MDTGRLHICVCITRHFLSQGTRWKTFVGVWDISNGSFMTLVVIQGHPGKKSTLPQYHDPKKTLNSTQMTPGIRNQCLSSGSFKTLVVVRLFLCIVTLKTLNWFPHWPLEIAVRNEYLPFLTHLHKVNTSPSSCALSRHTISIPWPFRPPRVPYSSVRMQWTQRWDKLHTNIVRARHVLLMLLTFVLNG